MGFARERTVIVHNGFDPAEFNPALASAHRMNVRAELGIPEDAIVLLLAATNSLARVCRFSSKLLPWSATRGSTCSWSGGECQRPICVASRTSGSRRFHYARLARRHGAHLMQAQTCSCCPRGMRRSASRSWKLLRVVFRSSLPTCQVPVTCSRRRERAAATRTLDTDELAGLVTARVPTITGIASGPLEAAATVEDHTWAELLDRALQEIAARPRRALTASRSCCRQPDLPSTARTAIFFAHARCKRHARDDPRKRGRASCPVDVEQPVDEARRDDAQRSRRKIALEPTQPDQ